MWISKDRYDAIVRENEDMQKEIEEYRKELEELKNKSGDATVKRMMKLAEECQINVHTDEFQHIMTRLFMDIAGRESPVIKAYSATSFVKDNPEEILKRADELRRESSIVTKQLEDLKKKK